MAGINKVIVLGRVGKDPVIRSLQSGDKVANLSMATSEEWKDKATGEKKEKTEWHSVTVWGPLANVVEQYVKKGDMLYVQGKLQTRKWQDQSGNDRYTTEVVLQGFGAELQLLGSKGGGASQGDGETRAGNVAGGNAGNSGGNGYAAAKGNGTNGAGRPPATQTSFIDDEIPF
ncbi:MAG: single-stranded DNA-binding protein [Hyphomicrobiaceae bacterium]